MSKSWAPDPDRLFPVHKKARALARDLYEPIRHLPIVSPHGHCDPAWFADNEPFPDPATLLIVPDHYIFRMLYSRGVALSDLGVPARDSSDHQPDPQIVWRRFAEHWDLFLGTPTRLWLDHVFSEVFHIEEPLTGRSADRYFATMTEALGKKAFRPRALFERFNVDILATTDSATDPLAHHQAIRGSGWPGRIAPTFRPDSVLDPAHDQFHTDLRILGEMTGEDVERFDGYLEALRQRRAAFKAMGATATDHAAEWPITADLDRTHMERLHADALAGRLDQAGASAFYGHMLTEMARMSVEDGLVMQLHAGSSRNHNMRLFQAYGRDMGADIPRPTNWVDGLKALLNAVGAEPGFRLLLFTLDEGTYSRELAPLAGHWPCLMLGPPWWFHDSVEGILRFYDRVVETAGYSNLAGFNDDTRAFLSIPARHDVWRRVTCRHLSMSVCEGRLARKDAENLAPFLAADAARQAYNLG